MNETRNSRALNDFITYCYAHPQERFWQALRNWSDYNFIVGHMSHDEWTDGEDTYYKEGK